MNDAVGSYCSKIFPTDFLRVADPLPTRQQSNPLLGTVTFFASCLISRRTPSALSQSSSRWAFGTTSFPESGTDRPRRRACCATSRSFSLPGGPPRPRPHKNRKSLHNPPRHRHHHACHRPRNRRNVLLTGSRLPQTPRRTRALLVAPVTRLQPTRKHLGKARPIHAPQKTRQG